MCAEKIEKTTNFFIKQAYICHIIYDIVSIQTTVLKNGSFLILAHTYLFFSVADGRVNSAVSFLLYISVYGIMKTV